MVSIVTLTYKQVNIIASKVEQIQNQISVCVGDESRRRTGWFHRLLSLRGGQSKARRAHAAKTRIYVVCIWWLSFAVPSFYPRNRRSGLGVGAHRRGERGRYNIGRYNIGTDWSGYSSGCGRRRRPHAAAKSKSRRLLHKSNKQIRRRTQKTHSPVPTLQILSFLLCKLVSL